MSTHDTDNVESPAQDADSTVDALFDFSSPCSPADPDEDRAKARRRRIASVLSHPAPAD